jgi:hypothetical protein
LEKLTQNSRFADAERRERSHDKTQRNTQRTIPAPMLVLLAAKSCSRHWVEEHWGRRLIETDDDTCPQSGDVVAALYVFSIFRSPAIAGTP